VLIRHDAHERDTAEVLVQLGEVYLATGRLQEAEELTAHMLELCDTYTAPKTVLAQSTLSP
jgi:hypothetical protein